MRLLQEETDRNGRESIVLFGVVREDATHRGCVWIRARGRESKVLFGVMRKDANRKSFFGIGREDATQAEYVLMHERTWLMVVLFNFGLKLDRTLNGFRLDLDLIAFGMVCDC